MAKKKTTKKNTARTSEKSTDKTSAKSSSKSTSRKRKYTPKKKAEELEAQQSWDLEQKLETAPEPAAEPAAEPVPAEVSEVQAEPAAEPADVDVPKKQAEPVSQPANVAVPEESSEPISEPADVAVPESPADAGTKEISIEDYQPVIWIQPETESVPEEKPEEPAVPLAEAAKSSKHERGFDAAAAAPARALTAARIAGAAFFGVLVLMFVLNIATEDVLYSDQENRVFQQLPKFSFGNYLSGRFESQLDNYVSDQFAFRNTFIKIKSSADLTIGQIKANGVFKAKDSYLMEDIAYPDEASFRADINALEQFRKKYKKKKMYFMLVPNAANILSDKLPGGVVTHDQNEDMDRLFSAVKEMGYKPVDVREELTEASKKQQVYYRTDHHWTTDGAYVAFKKAAKVMKLKSETEYEAYTVKKDFVGTLCSKSGFTNGRKDAIKIYLPAGDKYLNSVIRYKDKKEKTTMYYDMANLDIKDAYTVFGGTNQSLITITTPTKKNRHLLVVKDSYANCFIPFLTQDYRTITIVDPRYYYENIATVIKADEIDDVLFLYNANTFFSDNYMRMMLTNK